MGWPNAPSAPPHEHWTYLLGETAANSRTIMADMQDVKASLKEGERRMDFLTEENIRRNADIQALSARLDRHHGPPREHLSWLAAFPALAEKAEMIGGFIKVLGTVKETVVWALSGTAIYQMLASPVWIKDFIHAILVKIGVSS